MNRPHSRFGLSLAALLCLVALPAAQASSKGQNRSKPRLNTEVSSPAATSSASSKLSFPRIPRSKLASSSTSSSPKPVASKPAAPKPAPRSTASTSTTRTPAPRSNPVRLFGGALFASFSTASSTTHLQSRDKGRLIESVRTTAYTHTEADHLVYGRRNALGGTLRSSTSYTSAASDWSRFPPGTRFSIVGDDRIYVIDDYGSALVGTSTIDLYKTSHSAMNRWGVRHVDIEILDLGCYDRARSHLEKTLAYAHCRRMYEALPG